MVYVVVGKMMRRYSKHQVIQVNIDLLSWSLC